jgi:predicted RecB family nuclease
MNKDSIWSKNLKMLLKTKIQNWLEKKINCTVLPEDVFSYSPKTGQMFLGSYLMTENEIKNIQEEIKFIENTKIWEIWNNTVKKQAIDTAIYNSTTFEDMRTAKAFLKVLGTFQDINAIIKSWKPPVPLKSKPSNPIDI